MAGPNTQFANSQGLNNVSDLTSNINLGKNTTTNTSPTETPESLLGKARSFAESKVQVKSIELKTLNSEGLYKSRSGGNVYDVVHDYPWTLTPQAYRKDGNTYSDVPRIMLYEFEQDLNTFYASLLMWFRSAEDQIKNVGDDTSPYIGLYYGKSTETQFIFPYFGNYMVSHTPQWNKSEGIFQIEALANLKNLMSNVAMGMNAAPGVAINQPHTWVGAEPASYPVVFELFNTVGSDTNEAYQNMEFNLALINRLRMSALHDQRNIILASPPALFEVVIPGVRMSPAAVIGNITVENVGQVNYIKGKNFPDAYRVTLNITELITESRQILDASVRGGEKVTSTIKAIRDTSATKNVVGGS